MFSLNAMANINAGKLITAKNTVNISLSTDTDADEKSGTST